MKPQPRNVLLGIPRIREKRRIIEIVLDFKLPISELQPSYQRKILKKIAELEAGIIAANYFGVGETAHMTLFLDLGQSNIPAEKIKEIIRSLEFISEVSVFEPKPLLFDTVHFPLTDGLERVCVISVRALARMFEGMTNIMGSGAFTILWRMGLEHGKNMVKIIRNLTLGGKLKEKEMLEAFRQFYQAEGWGIIEYIDVNLKQKSGKVRIYRSVAEAVTKRSGMPICYYTKGCLTAFLEEVFCEKPHIEEVRCMAMGDEFCEFEFKC